jgi:hypothetical protein
MSREHRVEAGRRLMPADDQRAPLVVIVSRGSAERYGPGRDTEVTLTLPGAFALMAIALAAAAASNRGGCCANTVPAGAKPQGDQNSQH